MILTSPGALPGSLQRRDGAERHFVVVGVDRGDVRVVGDQLFSDRLTHGPLVVRRLLGNDLDVGVEFLETFEEPVVAIRRDVHARCSEQDGELALAAGLPDHRIGRTTTLFDEVGADPSDVVLARRLGREQSIDRHDRHALFLGVVECGVEALAVQRRDDQRVDALIDHSLDVGDLLVEVRLGVRDDEIDAACFGLVTDRLGLGDTERVRLTLGLGEPDRRAGKVDLVDPTGVLIERASVTGRLRDLLARTRVGPLGRRLGAGGRSVGGRSVGWCGRCGGDGLGRRRSSRALGR